MCIMHEAEPYGHLLINGHPVTDTQLASLTGVSMDQIAALLSDLEDAGVYSRNGNGVVYSRRMTRDEKRAKAASKEGSKGGNPKLKGDNSKPGYIYLIGVRSDGRYKIGASVNPQNRIKKIRLKYRGESLRVIRQWPVDNMGTPERTLHQKFAKKGDEEWFLLSPQDIEKIDEFLDPKGDPKEDPKDDPLPQRPEARVQKGSGSGLERRSLSPEVSEAYGDKPDPERFSMTMDWKMELDVETRLEQKFMPFLGLDGFWRQCRRFLEHHCQLGTVDTQQGFSRSLENWLERANANLEKTA